MEVFGSPIRKLIDELAKLPGIGQRSAQRLAFHIVRMPTARAEALAAAVLNAKRGVNFCSVCCNLTDEDPCGVCANAARDARLIMVVEDPRDMAAYERTNQYKGLYHVLHGAISPMNGVGPNELKIKELLTRVGQAETAEVIMATNPNVEGEATALYISKLIKPLGVKVTRIAHGVPVGGDLEYVDEVTLSRSLEWRREM
jgi:recombination protein RecR